MMLTSNPGNLSERSMGDLGFSTKASEYQGNSANIEEYKHLSGVSTFIFSISDPYIHKNMHTKV